MNPQAKPTIEDIQSELEELKELLRKDLQKVETLNMMLLRTQALYNQNKIRYENLDKELALLDGRFSVVEPKATGIKHRPKLDLGAMFKKMSTKDQREFIRGVMKGE